MRWIVSPFSASGHLSWNCVRLFQTRLILFIVLDVFWPKSTSARIHYVTVPRTVNVDQTDEAILDCRYDYIHQLNNFIVVKWFFNGDSRPVYSWLPNTHTRNYNPQFEKFIDKSYRFSADRFEIYRGIRFARLHQNLTGNYSCSVSSKSGHFQETKPMTLYQTPQFEKFEVTSNGGNFSIHCDVNRLMRPAEVRIYKLNGNEFELLHADVNLTSQNDRFQSTAAQLRATYSLQTSSGTDSSSLRFQCTVVYFNTDINVTRTQHVSMTMTSSSDNSSKCPLNVLFYIVLGLLLFAPS